ncbi:Histidine biosynthesis bifunctional protein hisB [Cryptotrichosporon argae]
MGDQDHIKVAQTTLPVPDVPQPEGHASTSRPRLYVLDYGAGNVRSLANSIKELGYEFEWIKDVSDFDKAEKLIFPGVGAFGQATESLKASGLHQPLLDYIASGRPYFGICVGMQVLFASSAESPGATGLAVFPTAITKFDSATKAVPHMGWSSAGTAGDDYYFVHSYAVMDTADAYTTSRYGEQEFASSVRRDNVLGVQFHPEKSGRAGLDLLRRWIEGEDDLLGVTAAAAAAAGSATPSCARRDRPTSRIVACLDVRSNDAGDLVVTKGDQYDVREKDEGGAGSGAGVGGGGVRNLGKPVDLARRYFAEGADEICFLNITSFRSSALRDQPMLDVVRRAAETVFVPLTVGGGIRDTVDPDGTARGALEVAAAYFRAGADKVSIGSDAVFAVEAMLAREAAGAPALEGTTAIETISCAYGSQAVVVSIDPRRVYYDTTRPGWIDAVPEPHRACLVTGETSTTRTRAQEQGKAWWYQCTVSGGRAVRDMDVVQLARGVERLGAGEILLNSVDRDGSGAGFDLDLVRLVRNAVSIPVVASSGAGSAADFVEVFAQTNVEAALAAGIFHRKEVGIDEVKRAVAEAGLPVRQ